MLSLFLGHVSLTSWIKVDDLRASLVWQCDVFQMELLFNPDVEWKACQEHDSAKVERECAGSTCVLRSRTCLQFTSALSLPFPYNRRTT